MSGSSKYAKMTVSKLQAECKRLGTKSTGSKDELLGRLEAYDTCEELGLKAWNGSNPALIVTPSQMNIACAKCGLSTMLDSWDLLLQQLVKHLKATSSNSSSSSSGSSSSKVSASSSSSGSDSGVEVAQRVLQLDEVDDWLGILNIATPAGLPQLVSTSSTASMRKAYLKISLLIHPDKLQRVFSEATKAFQALCRAFERLSSPSYASEAPAGRGSGGKKADVATIARSNEGCFRTRVCCPRCKEKWSEGGLDGNPDYVYNFLMMGLKQYTCSTCLFGFGCMTAIHKCPHCQSPFEYSPADFHRKLTCSRDKCAKAFGFFMFKTSDRVLEDLKRDVKVEVETWAKQKEAKERRAARSGDRNNSLTRKEEIKAYLLGLSDSCPLCGIELEELTEDLQREHLRECKGNSAAHVAYSQKKAAVKAKAESKEMARDMQQSVQSEAAFMLLGAKPEQMWLMDDKALGRQARLKDMDTAGASRDELIARLASSSSSSGGQLAITVDGEGGPQVRRLTADSVPRNYQSFSLAQLKSVLAAHGRIIDKAMDRSDVLDIFEDELSDDKPKAKKMIEDDKAARKRRKRTEDDDEDFSP